MAQGANAPAAEEKFQETMEPEEPITEPEVRNGEGRGAFLASLPFSSDLFFFLSDFHLTFLARAHRGGASDQECRREGCSLESRRHGRIQG